MTTPQEKLTSKLPLLADKVDYPETGPARIRWGQVLRTPPSAAALLAKASETGRLKPLREIARVKSGLVTRANAYFIVEDLDFDRIPNRFRITKRDFKTVAVVLDGKSTPHRVSRKYLKPVVKGPDALLGPKEVAVTNQRLFDVTDSEDDLRSAKDSDTLAYLRRGKTINYNVSPDKLKGGIPAERSNIKTRKPYWYSLNVPAAGSGHIVVPEHFDRRFIATALGAHESGHVVIDTCYVVELKNPAHQELVVAVMNSLLTWYQIEQRGRTQHGEGVLKVKIPDFEGILVLDPDSLDEKETAALIEAFRPLTERRTLPVVDELQREDRTNFDTSYMTMLGLQLDEAETTRLTLARELREAMAERKTRMESVADLKAQRTPKVRASRAIDAFAARIVSETSPYPDPRHHLSPTSPAPTPVPISPFDGTLTLGEGLFDNGKVLVGSDLVADTDGPNQARFVRIVLTIDPQQAVVDVPGLEELDPALDRWFEDVGVWWEEFLVIREQITKDIQDERTVTAVTLRALELAHACELPPNNVVSDFSGRASSTKRSSIARKSNPS